MPIKNLLEEYRARQDRLENLRLKASQLLDYAVKARRIKIHALSSRIKSFDSFAKKVRNKNLKDPFNHVSDLVGLRVVCLFLSDLNKVGEIVKKTFTLISEDDKIENRPRDVFNYMDIQYIVALRNHAVGGAETMPFEIQVRTIAQDAWASVSHELYYKKPETMPRELERDFYALSALFYVADQHFGMLRQRSSASLLTE